jgi:hypothetical protein
VHCAFYFEFYNTEILRDSAGIGRVYRKGRYRMRTIFQYESHLYLFSKVLSAFTTKFLSPSAYMYHVLIDCDFERMNYFVYIMKYL